MQTTCTSTTGSLEGLRFHSSLQIRSSVDFDPLRSAGESTQQPPQRGCYERCRPTLRSWLLPRPCKADSLLRDRVRQRDARRSHRNKGHKSVCRFRWLLCSWFRRCFLRRSGWLSHRRFGLSSCWLSRYRFDDARWVQGNSGNIRHPLQAALSTLQGMHRRIHPCTGQPHRSRRPRLVVEAFCGRKCC